MRARCSKGRDEPHLSPHGGLKPEYVILHRLHIRSDKDLILLFLQHFLEAFVKLYKTKKDGASHTLDFLTEENFHLGNRE